MTKETLGSVALCLSLTLGLGGCGGEDGGSGSGASGLGTATGGASSSGGGGTPRAEYCASTEDWPEEAAAKELEILELVNQRRAEGADCGGQQMEPRAPLEMQPSLQCAARVHTLDMFEEDYFSHTGHDGSTPKDRMDDAGYEGRGWAENIAAGNSSAEATMNQWMNSSGHCRNIMGNYRYLGVGYVAGGSRRHLWTQTFGN